MCYIVFQAIDHVYLFSDRASKLFLEAWN